MPYKHPRKDRQCRFKDVVEKWRNGCHNYATSNGLCYVHGGMKKMSMSTHVVAFVPPDEKWKKMKAVYDACYIAIVTVPDEVQLFFEDEKPSSNGIRIDHVKLNAHHVISTYNADNENGFDIDVEQLLKVFPNVKIVRVYNSYR